MGCSQNDGVKKDKIKRIGDIRDKLITWFSYIFEIDKEVKSSFILNSTGK